MFSKVVLPGWRGKGCAEPVAGARGSVAKWPGGVKP